MRQTLRIFAIQTIDFIHAIVGGGDRFSLPEQRPRHMLQAKGRKLPKGGLQTVNAVDNQTALGRGVKIPLLEPVFTPFQSLAAAAAA